MVNRKMTSEERAESNAELVRAFLLPTIFLTVALLGGVRVTQAGELLFLPPPLITLLLASLLLLLFARGRLIELEQWFSYRFSPLTNLSNALTLLAIFLASAQAFNAALPESGLFHWMLSFFFLWTLWNNLFAPFDARRLTRSLGVLLGTAFIFKHILVSSLYAPEGSWPRKLASALFEGVTLGTAHLFAASSGYIAFFALALYVVGLILTARLRPPRIEIVAARGDDHLMRD